MKSKNIYLIILAAAIAGCGQTKQKNMTENNPLFEKWSGPYNGVPPFDKVKVDQFIPAFEAAMTEKQKEINAIVENTQEPDFVNTIEALENSGQTLHNLEAVYGVWTSNMGSAEMDKVQEVIEPKLTSFNDSIYQNKKLFGRIEKLYNDTVGKNYSEEQQRLLWRYYTNYVLAGAKLDDAAKKKVTDINKELAALFTKFRQHQLADENDKYVEITTLDDLKGVPEDVISSYAQTAKQKNKNGVWLISNTRSAVEPFLTFAINRPLREKVFKMFVSRGDNGDANDNNAIIPQILKLRAEKAHLMGYETFAHLKLADKMAKTPERALELMEAVWPAAVNRVHEEVADMQKIADAEKSGIQIEPWDYRYYAEKVRKAKYDIDQNEVKEYLQLDKLREGMFYVAGELFNLKFTKVNDVPVFHPDVSVYKVENNNDGKFIGLWYFDPYARTGKRSGAWMTAYREQNTLEGNVTTIVSNNCNFIKGKGNEPVLVSWDDATTLFHEFGHALHGLCSQVKYPSLSGTNVATDYVEFPSQLLERWLPTKKVLQQYALHYKTGKALPDELLAKINKSAEFNQGFQTVEYLSSALVDMKIHLEGDKAINPKDFEKKTLEALHMPSEIVMRHRLPQFGHIFSDDAYAAGYYSYLWSDVISADATEAFTETKDGLYDKAVAGKLLQYVFSKGATMEEGKAYRMFRGKDPEVSALMRSRGFISK
ncbi:MAG: M3 family metallopeptidase [Bacteroidetes bacterium]|jgi:peptidyl-dipeptidase Dcp|nr:M3 family metallopeptidase [Bacteroidota bacterium]